MADLGEKEDQEFAAAAREPAEDGAASVGTRDGEDRKEGIKGENDNKKYGDTKVGLTLRILVAAYVLYLAYGLIQGFGEAFGKDRIFIGAAIIIFLVAGGAIMILSAKKLIRKEYRDADEGGEEKE